MKSIPTITRSFAAMAILLACSVSVAAPSETGYYYQLNFGLSNFSSELTDVAHEIDDDAAATGESAGPGGVDDSDYGWSFAIGYRINKFIGVELAYVELGKQSFSATGDSADVPWELIDPNLTAADLDILVNLDATASLDGDIHSAGALVSVFGMYSVGNLEFSARAGVLFAKTKLTTSIFLQSNTDPTDTGSGNFHQTSSTNELMSGAGIGYTLFDHLQLRLDAGYYLNVGEQAKTLETDIVTVTAGIAYRY